MPQSGDYERNESTTSRFDRQWNELLQEMRVMQTGVQVLTGFLLTIPFQQRFTELSDVERGQYVAAVLLAAMSTLFLTAAVASVMALIIDVVFNETAGWVAGGTSIVLFGVVWLLWPLAVRRAFDED